jgi:hypothetical protein
MSPVTHFLTGWVVANSAPLNWRERAVVTFAAVIPDLDGLGIVPDLLTRHSQHPLLWFRSTTTLFTRCCSQSSFPCLPFFVWPQLDGSIDVIHCVPSAPSRRSRWSTGAGRLHLAHPVLISVQHSMDLAVARSMEAKCLAEYRTYAIFARPHDSAGT